MPGHDEPIDLTQLLQAAAGGDQRAWDAVVERFKGLLWAVARAHRLADADAADVVQITWLRLVEHLPRIREPAAVGAWLATTARREALRALRRAGRETLPGDGLDREPDDRPRSGPEAAVLAADRDRLLWESLERLTQRCRMLLRVLMADPAPSYAEVGAALDMPVGSIGPTRRRCLELMRRELAQVGISAGTGGSI
ncbi:MAG TPA: sigma-70 family RNA polymerase sigma factor [Egibacteraceae bacterium]|nr:sigma-70 family RNA polymerase sigma factor [Egibacteraceae bacterium]